MEIQQWKKIWNSVYISQDYTHTDLTALFPGLPGWAGTRKVKPIWLLLKQETVGGSGISWAICKSASRSRQITRPAPHHSVFYRPDALPATQPTASKHWSHKSQDYCDQNSILSRCHREQGVAAQTMNDFVLDFLHLLAHLRQQFVLQRVQISARVWCRCRLRRCRRAKSTAQQFHAPFPRLLSFIYSVCFYLLTC